MSESNYVNNHGHKDSVILISDVCVHHDIEDCVKTMIEKSTHQKISSCPAGSSKLFNAGYEILELSEVGILG